MSTICKLHIHIYKLGHLFLLVYHIHCVVTPWSKTQHILFSYLIHLKLEGLTRIKLVKFVRMEKGATVIFSIFRLQDYKDIGNF